MATDFGPDLLNGVDEIDANHINSLRHAVNNVEDYATGKFDPTTGHEHTGAAGDGPPLDASNILYTSVVSGFTPSEVKTALDALAGVRIVEMGSNANGEYMRWENGLQVCWGTSSATRTITNTWGALYGMGPPYPKQMFPAVFVDVPAVSIKLAASQGWTAFFNQIPTVTTSDFEWELLRATSLADEITWTITWSAIGRWK